MTFIDKVKEFLPSGRISKYGYMDALKDMVSPGNLKAMAGYSVGALVFGVEAVAAFYALKKLFDYIKDTAQANPDSQIGQSAQKTREITGVDIFGISDKSKVLNESIKQQNDSSIFSLEKTKILEEEPNPHPPTVK